MSDKKIIGIFDKTLPVGTLAWHKRYHYCQVMEAEGDERVIKVVRLGLREPVFKTYAVSVKELSPLDASMARAVKSMGIDFSKEEIDP